MHRPRSVAGKSRQCAVVPAPPPSTARSGACRRAMTPKPRDARVKKVSAVDRRAKDSRRPGETGTPPAAAASDPAAARTASAGETSPVASAITPLKEVREADVERALFRWYERHRQRQLREGVSVRPPGANELRRRALALARRAGAGRLQLASITRAWVRRWQERYGVPRVGACAPDSPPATSPQDAPREATPTRECSLKSAPESPCASPTHPPALPPTPPPAPPPPPASPPPSATVTSRNTVSPASDPSPPALQLPSPKTKQELDAPMEKILEDDDVGRILAGYSDEQVYCAVAFELEWRSLPDRTLDSGGGDGAGTRVWVLGAASRSGHHRTRLLVAGRLWRPPCLRHVNMLSQPVVYAGGGSGALTADLFAWWFHREFAPAAAALHGARGAVLVAERAPFVAAEGDCVWRGGAVRLVVSAPTAPLDARFAAGELRARYGAALLAGMLADSADRHPRVPDHLARFTLKDAFPLLHRAWLQVRSATFRRCWTTAPATAPAAPAGQPTHSHEDRLLLLELQWLAHDLGLEVTDDDLAAWVAGRWEARLPAEGGAEAAGVEAAGGVTVKTEPEEESLPAGEGEEGAAGSVGAAEAAHHLMRALLWMESEPLEPSLLLVVRDVLALAKQASKMGLAPAHPGAALPFFCHNGDHLAQPPPAHMGIPPYQLDPKASAGAMGLTRPPMYPFSTGQYPYPMLSPEMSQVAASWHSSSMYPISTAAAGFRSPYPSSLPITSTSLSSDFYRFSPTGLIPPHPGLTPHPHPHSLATHPAIVTPGPKQELGAHPADHNHRSSSMDQKISTSSGADGTKTQESGQTSNNQDKKKPHIKKPLNAFMLYMKEMRAKVVAECTLKESAAINQILGRRWHALGREEQAKYYELARRERQLHMQLYPDWSSRANSSRGKKRKRKQETNDGGNSMKKCRARYGLDQQSQWCKPCRRKKKCIRYMESGDSVDGNQSEDNLGSCGSAGEAQTPPEEDSESLHHSLSSPGGLSGLSSLTSPSMILPSPSTSLASPSVSMASPCMSLQSPLTPHESSAFECKPSMNNMSVLSNHQPTSTSSSTNAVGSGGALSLHHHHPPHHPPPPGPPLHRNPVGTNPHDINNPLSVNQLTGQCIKTESSSGNKDSSSNSRPVISVT